MTPRAIPMRVGEATVYVEQVGESLQIEPSDELYTVASSPREAFEQASTILQECVSVLGERLEGLAQKVKPSQISVEFSLSFEAEGSTHIIPVLLTGKTKAQSGLKVTAVWGGTGVV